MGQWPTSRAPMWPLLLRLRASNSPPTGPHQSCGTRSLADLNARFFEGPCTVFVCVRWLCQATRTSTSSSVNFDCMRVRYVRSSSADHAVQGTSHRLHVSLHTSCGFRSSVAESMYTILVTAPLLRRWTPSSCVTRWASQFRLCWFCSFLR